MCAAKSSWNIASSKVVIYCPDGFQVDMGAISSLAIGLREIESVTLLKMLPLPPPYTALKGGSGRLSIRLKELICQKNAKSP